MELERRVETLESLFSFQERTIAQLDAVVRAFAQRVEVLEAACARLERALPAEPLAGEGKPADRDAAHGTSHLPPRARRDLSP
ncbi:MAG: hypothetical protein D6731_13430 [Planctomycetota bacterium]|nr:MAG: hypothetical protein D6731_13430 [Planctomycetota bacterium]